jgi:membrane associated rhomboid family serine protease
MNTYSPPSSFQILPPVIKNLLIINILFFVATYVLQKANIINLNYYLALFHWSSPLFKPWQIITHIFMHGSLSHLFVNMFALWMFGTTIENYMGSKRFLIYYIICGLGAALCYSLVFTWDHAKELAWFNSIPKDTKLELIHQALSAQAVPVNMFPSITPMLGASGAVMGVLFAFGYLFPNRLIYIYLLIPIKAKYLVAIYAAIELILGIANSPNDTVAHFAHLGGMLFGFLLFKFWKIPYRK